LNRQDAKDAKRRGRRIGKELPHGGTEGAVSSGKTAISDREKKWLAKLNTAVDGLPETEAEANEVASVQPELYGL
jgi:hypothetical protein